MFYIAMAYASLYKSYGKTLDAVKADDVTVSLVRKAKPYGLFRYFKEHGYLVKDVYRGIYYVEGNVLFPTQIIVTKELDFSEHIWLGALSDQLNIGVFMRAQEVIIGYPQGGHNSPRRSCQSRLWCGRKPCRCGLPVQSFVCMGGTPWTLHHRL